MGRDAKGQPTPALLGKLKAKQLSHLDPSALLRESGLDPVEVVQVTVVESGAPAPADSHFPEDWIASTTRAICASIRPASQVW